MGKERFQLFIDKDQKILLKRLQMNYKVSTAEIIRQAIDKYLEEKSKEEFPPTDPITNNLLSVAGICKGGPSYLADKHDHYLYHKIQKR